MTALVGFYVVLGLCVFLNVMIAVFVAQRDNARDELRQAREELAALRRRGLPRQTVTQTMRPTDGVSEAELAAAIMRRVRSQ